MFIEVGWKNASPYLSESLVLNGRDMQITKEQSVAQLNDKRHSHTLLELSPFSPQTNTALHHKGSRFYFAYKEKKIFSEHFAQKRTCFVLGASSSKCWRPPMQCCRALNRLKFRPPDEVAELSGQETNDCHSASGSCARFSEALILGKALTKEKHSLKLISRSGSLAQRFGLNDT